MNVREKCHQFEDFIDALANQQVSEDVFNQYSYALPENGVRRSNLLLWLEEMEVLKPSVLLVGEAPGYMGARLTGVPFTSEKLLLKGLFGKENVFKKTEEYKNICTERTATIFWQCMEVLKIVPLVWNAFPFHPFKSGKPTSNRAPNRYELSIGEEFLKKLIEIFGIKSVITVGKKADHVLNKIGVNHDTCRHPSMGGQKDFKQGMIKLIK